MDPVVQKFLNDYRSWIFSRIIKRFGYTSADDIFQEVYLAVLESELIVDPSKNSTAWLKRRIDYILGHIARDKKRRQSLESRLSPKPLSVSDEHRFTELIITLQDIKTPESEDVIDLLIQGFSRSDIARILGISDSKVFRICKKIAERLTSE